MTKRALPLARLKEMVAAEIRSLEDLSESDIESVVIHVTGTGWLATVRSQGHRLDERVCAAVREAGLRLSGIYDVSSKREPIAVGFVDLPGRSGDTR
jgi:hypothetical protein